MRCEYHKHNGPGRCPICQQNLRNRIDEVKKKCWAGVDWGKGDDQSVVTTHFAPLSADKCRAWSEKIRDVAVRNLNEALAGKNWTKEIPMKAPTEEQLRDPAWWNKNAPEGATHRSAKTGAWFQIIAGSVWEWIDDGWMPKELIARPTKPEPQEWDGEGLPPVGCECEYVPDPVCTPHMTVKGVFIGRVNGEDFVDTGLSVDRMKAINPARRFRPIRTQAEREREELADLCRAKFNQHTSSSNSYLWQQVADAIIAAGWRKGE